MIFFDLSTVKLAFKAICLSVTAGMIVYWIVKYIKNEDVSVVEYRLIKNMETVLQPEFTICVVNPFIEEKLGDINPDITTQKYLQYLSGEIPGDATYKGIDYENVTIQLLKYLNYVQIIGRFSDGQKYKNCTLVVLTSYPISSSLFFLLSFWNLLSRHDQVYFPRVSALHFRIHF